MSPHNAADGFDMPVIGILCDGMSFEFFSYDGKKRKFTRGCLPAIPGDSAVPCHGLQLNNSTCFIAGLRQICEIIFDLFLDAYISGLTSFKSRLHEQSFAGEKEGRFRSLDEWDEGLKHAQEAFGKFRAAETKRKAKDSEQANILVEEAMNALKLRYEIF